MLAVLSSLELIIILHVDYWWLGESSYRLLLAFLPHSFWNFLSALLAGCFLNDVDYHY